tara:strand:- start:328 stop:588 length:261 start_codon:yes stop_codon:yes gene_type:complete
VKKIKLFLINITLLVIVTLFLVTNVIAGGPRAKFYDFNDQLIDGEIKKPSTLYTDARERVKFNRLLRLKKSFMKELFNSSKEKVFK